MSEVVFVNMASLPASNHQFSALLVRIITIIDQKTLSSRRER